jgi:hypothetical protein
MVINSTWEKFQRATITLARSAPIKDRLTEAYRNYLAHIADEDLPKELRANFRAFTDALTRERPLLRGEDAFRATVRKMSTEEAEDMACSVVHMFGALPRLVATTTRPKTSTPVVPLYIAEA